MNVFIRWDFFFAILVFPHADLCFLWNFSVEIKLQNITVSQVPYHTTTTISRIQRSEDDTVQYDRLIFELFL